MVLRARYAVSGTALCRVGHYAFPTRCPALIWPMVLVISITEMQDDPSGVPAGSSPPYAMSGTVIAHATRCPYAAKPGTDTAYHATNTGTETIYHAPESGTRIAYHATIGSAMSGTELAYHAARWLWCSGAVLLAEYVRCGEIGYAATHACAMSGTEIGYAASVR
eukprot:2008868-Rhodomonas_salina.1